MRNKSSLIKTGQGAARAEQVAQLISKTRYELLVKSVGFFLSFLNDQFVTFVW